MTTLMEVVTAIGDRVQALDPRINWTWYIPPTANFPCAFVTPPTRLSGDLAEDTDTITFDLIVMVNRADPETQQMLWDYSERTGPLSIHQMFQDDRGLGFTDVDAHSGEFEFMGPQELGDQVGMTSRFAILVSLGP